jgi:galactokinase
MESLFQMRYQAIPEVWVRAPGRVDLMGSHTDYNLGYVLTLPISRDTWIAARPRRDQIVRVYSGNLDTECSFPLGHIRPGWDHDWSDYVRGVANVLQQEHFPVRPFDGIVESTVPIGSGLSSSAALECAIATVFEVLANQQLPTVQKALLCQRAENEFVGVNCGLLDQYTSCAGQAGCALLLDCRSQSSRAVRLPEDLQIVVCDTRARRQLTGSEYGVRRAQCEEGARRLGVTALREVDRAYFERVCARLPRDVARRCRFIIEENARVLQMAQALQEADYAAIAELTAQSFRGACELYEIGVPAMHAMMQAMVHGSGILGARQAGAGFGGCMVAFVQRDQVETFRDQVKRMYFDLTHVDADVYPVDAAAGAGPLPEGCRDVEAESNGGLI